MGSLATGRSERSESRAVRASAGLGAVQDYIKGFDEVYVLLKIYDQKNIK